MTRGRLAIFTICSNNYLPMAKVLFASAERYCPQAELFLCLGDERLSESTHYPANASVVTAEELAIPDFRDFAFRYSIMEFNTALKPFMIRHLLEQGFDAVLYFDPDIEIFAPLDVVIDPLRDGFNFVLTPHLCQPCLLYTSPNPRGAGSGKRPRRGWRRPRPNLPRWKPLREVRVRTDVMRRWSQCCTKMPGVSHGMVRQGQKAVMPKA